MQDSYSHIRQAGCKINLDLHITGLREDGYHTLDSIFWPINSPSDTLHFTVGHTQQFSVSCSVQGINTQENTLTKAYAAFCKAGGRVRPEFHGIHVHLTKGIPHGAGLGGGSSDAACVLRWCNEHAVHPLTESVLHEAALQVGADVPFFLLNKPARVQGIGEILEVLPKPWLSGYVVVLCPDVYISTPWAYKKIDEEKNKTFSKKLLTKTPLAYRTLFTGAGQQSTTVGNDFESVVFKAHPQLAKLKQDLLANGALMATLSGSGSSIIGIVKTKSEAEQLADTFLNAQCRVFIATL